MKPKPIPQYELPATESVFNLAGETGTDHDRAQREAQQRDRDRREAEALQQQQQPNLI
ncbi:MAG: hypothetical protein KGL39_45355 [Patescibacteria group bacterium]|nr:hypothetical protein [Patescibacteria group bacterium]